MGRKPLPEDERKRLLTFAATDDLFGRIREYQARREISTLSEATRQLICASLRKEGL